MNENQYFEAQGILQKDQLVEILAILEGNKPAMRLSCDAKRATRLIDLVEDLGLSFEQSDYAIETKVKTGGITHASTPLAGPPAPENFRNFYIGADDLAVRLAKIFDFADNRRFGGVLGYPECCIDFFQEYFSRKNCDLVMDVRNPKQRFEPLNNVACRHFGARLISHFPCRWDCEASLGMARENLSIISRRDPALADDILNVLDRDILYTRNVVLAVQDPRWTGSEMVFDRTTCLATGISGDYLVEYDGRSIRFLHENGCSEHIENFRWLPFRSQIDISLPESL